MGKLLNKQAPTDQGRTCVRCGGPYVLAMHHEPYLVGDKVEYETRRVRTCPACHDANHKAAEEAAKKAADEAKAAKKAEAEATA